MNLHRTSRRPYNKWQTAAIFLTLVFMVISALPNLYSDKTHLYLTKVSEPANEITTFQLKSQLANYQLTAEAIHLSDNNADITLSGQHDADLLIEQLSSSIPQGYQLTANTVNQAPAWLQALDAQPIKLGLDLSGGVLFVLEVDTDRALTDRLQDIALEVKSIAMQQRIRGVKVGSATKKGVSVDLLKVKPDQRSILLEAVFKAFPELSKQPLAGDKIKLHYAPEQAVSFRQQTMAQTIKTMRGRIEELGITEAVTQRQGKNRIRIELPGVHNPEQAKRIIGATAALDFYQLAQYSKAVSVLHIEDQNGDKLRLNGKAVFSGSNIKNATAGQDELGLPLVNLVLDNKGGNKMSNFSKQNIGKPMVTVFSEFYRDANDRMVKKSKVINLARIQQHLGSQFSITNMSSPEAAQELALLLRAGSLTAPVTIVQQRSIEATLGADNIDNGIMALSIGVSITLVFMAMWYRSMGLIANLSLLLNLVCLLGLMSLLPGAVLTLPGIAGLVLTVGMAVDTNVIIFERIKEELKKGRSLSNAIHAGYNNAFTTILDANATTMITGLILYAIGYGAVKGFAVILCLGIVTSMFTGVFVSRAVTAFAINHNSRQLLGVKL